MRRRSCALMCLTLPHALPPALAGAEILWRAGGRRSTLLWAMAWSRIEPSAAASIGEQDVRLGQSCSSWNGASSAKPRRGDLGWRGHMPQAAAFDCGLRAGRVATAGDAFEADVGISAGSIAAIGRNLGPGTLEIDAHNKLVLPGGIDAHAHIEQLSAAGIVNSDTFESATRSAALGGTTTAICFAAQHVGMDLTKVVADYTALARKGAMIDYPFHLIIADPTEITVHEHLPSLIAQGHASLRVFMTYDRLRVGDEKLLDILLAARTSGALVCVHAENHGMISWMGQRLIEKGYTAPKYHTVSHPRGCEAEAFN